MKLSLTKYAIFGFVCFMLLAVSGFISMTIVNFLPVEGFLAEILTWVFLSVIGGFLLVKIGLRFR